MLSYYWRIKVPPIGVNEMASFLKRGKTWQYCVSAKPKPIRKGGFKTKKEAQVAAAEVEDKLRKYKTPGTKKSSLMNTLKVG